MTTMKHQLNSLKGERTGCRQPDFTTTIPTTVLIAKHMTQSEAVMTMVPDDMEHRERKWRRRKPKPAKKMTPQESAHRKREGILEHIWIEVPKRKRKVDETPQGPCPDLAQTKLEEGAAPENFLQATVPEESPNDE
jgi:hypothetical protein